MTRIALAVVLAAAAIAGAQDFRPEVAAALKAGEKRIVIPPGIYHLSPDGGDKVVWTLGNIRDTEIVADGVTLVATKLTRAIAEIAFPGWCA